MACTKYTLAEYQALIAAIASGAQKVKYGDKEVDYRSLDDMLRLRIDMENCLFPNNNTNRNGGKRFVSFSKGTFPYRRKKC